jgi:hypothetical protein
MPTIPDGGAVRAPTRSRHRPPVSIGLWLKVDKIGCGLILCDRSDTGNSFFYPSSNGDRRRRRASVASFLLAWPMMRGFSGAPLA